MTISGDFISKVKRFTYFRSFVQKGQGLCDGCKTVSSTVG